MNFSIREKIAQNLFNTLNDYKTTLDDNVLRKVVRDPVVIEEMSRESFPLAYIESSDETREDTAFGGSAGITRFATIEYIVKVFVHGKEADSKRNDLIQLIEDAIEVDRTRGGNALDTQLTSIEILYDEDLVPYYGIDLTIEVAYCYKKGSN